MADAGELRVVSSADELAEVGERLSLPRVALAPALVEPGTRLLSDGAGAAALLRRQWVGDGSAEAVVLHRAGVPLEHPAVVATAVAWGCERVRHASTDRTVPIHPPPADAPVADRFLHLAALAATRVEVVVALTPEHADEAAHTAAAEVLRALDLPVRSEERRDGPVPDGSPWVVLDPLDGTGNFSAGLPPWAFSAALVEGGRPVAGLVVDLSSGRRWRGAEGAGAWRDGVSIAPRSGSTVLVPSAPAGGVVAVPSTADRVRIPGCTSVELCLVADGSAAAWHDLDRSGTHVHDVAGGLAVLLAAGGVALTADGEPVELSPDGDRTLHLVAAPSLAAACELLAALA
ncbi:MAG: inositol monophosphatase family protein [Blastococcus sp.]